MTLKLLIDECLSPSLVEQAQAAGYPESTCVLHRGWAGCKDWTLIGHVIEHDFTLVTHNARDFSRRRTRGARRVARDAGNPRRPDLPYHRAADGSPAPARSLWDRLGRDRADARPRQHLPRVIEDASGEVEVFIYDLPAAPM